MGEIENFKSGFKNENKNKLETNKLILYIPLMLVIPSRYIKQPGIANRNSYFFSVWVFSSSTSMEIISISQLRNAKKKLKHKKGARYFSQFIHI